MFCISQHFAELTIQHTVQDDQKVVAFCGNLSTADGSNSMGSSSFDKSGYSVFFSVVVVKVKFKKSGNERNESIVFPA